MKSLNTLLGAAFGSSLLLFGACADSVGGPAPTTASDVQLQHVTMALSNDTSASATAHVMIWASADGSLAYEFLGFAGPDAREGLSSHVDKRAPRFDGPTGE